MNSNFAFGASGFAILISLLFAFVLTWPFIGKAAATDAPFSNIPTEPVTWVMAGYAGKSAVEQSPDARLAVAEVKTGVSAFLSSNSVFAVCAGAEASWTEFRFYDAASASAMENRELWTTRLLLDFSMNAGEKFEFRANAAPGIYTDCRHTGADDFFTQARAAVVYKPSPAARLALGVSCDRDFGDNRVYPVGGLIWNLSRSIRIDMVLPRPRLSYAPTKNTVFFAGAEPSGNMWTFWETDDSNGKLKFQAWRFSAGVESRLAARFWLHAECGADVAREYKTAERGNITFNSQLGDAFFAGAGLLFR